MANAWGGSFGTPSAWGVSWGIAGVAAPAAAGPYVVLIPHEPIHFHTRGDLALFALASFTKQEALRTRVRPIPMLDYRDHRVPIHI